MDDSLRGLFPLVRVLVVEDNPIATRILSIFLARRSIEHVTVTTGPQAIDHFAHSGPFHVVLMNLGLAQQPGQADMDGLECTRAMRQFEHEHGGGGDGAHGIMPPAVIIALTADASAETHRAALLAGCNDVAVKPVRLTWIADKLVEVAALMGLVQPAMAMRELAAVVGGSDQSLRQEAEELHGHRDRASTWADQVMRDVGRDAQMAGQDGLGYEVLKPSIQRRRSVSADVQVPSAERDLGNVDPWGGELMMDRRAGARARTSSYQGLLPVCVEEDKQQQETPTIGEEMRS
ncbi:CheY-like superfamily, partial [Catenaria anguillulae PL171]